MFNILISTMLGAQIIEKHFTINKKLKGNDHYHSMDKKDLIRFNKNLKRLSDIYGSIVEKKYCHQKKYQEKMQEEV